tara:strand:- start:35 stop:319 length:285 start_codon:yes stop_codon:yes gene_type:complete
VGYYILFYKTSETYLKDREPYRALHLEHAKKAQEAGILILAGILEEPTDEAMLIFKTDQRELVENFAENDPYVIHVVVKHWVISPWKVAMGTLL